MIQLMSFTHSYRRFKPLIDFALTEGWQIECTHEGHLKLSKQGFSPLYTGSAWSIRTALVSTRQRICSLKEGDHNG